MAAQVVVNGEAYYRGQYEGNSHVAGWNLRDQHMVQARRTFFNFLDIVQLRLASHANGTAHLGTSTLGAGLSEAGRVQQQRRSSKGCAMGAQQPLRRRARHRAWRARGVEPWSHGQGDVWGAECVYSRVWDRVWHCIV